MADEKKTAAPTRKLLGARLVEDATFFNLHTRTLSITMEGIQLKVNAAGHLEIRKESNPGEVYEIHPAGIASLRWSE